MDRLNSKVGFFGTWKTGGIIPVTDNDIRFTVKDTSEAVLWAQLDATLTEDATLNGLTMDKTTVGNEDQFVRRGDRPARLRLSSSLNGHLRRLMLG